MAKKAEVGRHSAFEPEEWAKIRETLRAEPEKFGLPTRQYGSVVFASFNIRKLGRIKTGNVHERDEATFDFMADVCRHFDLLAVQEVMSDTEGLLELKRQMGPEYGIVHSDVTGAFPGRPGNAERLAYIYNRSLVERSEMVSDVTYDRTEVVKRIADHNDELHKVLEGLAGKRKVYGNKLEKYLDQGGARPREPSMSGIRLPGFLTFVRTPFAAGFRVRGHPDSEPYEFLAVNAHLNYGDSDWDRIWEGRALTEWMLGKVKTGKKNNLNVVLFGDLNLVFKNPRKDLPRIAESVHDAAKRAGLKKVEIVMPFLFPHPRPKQRVVPEGSVFRTNAKLNQTFDQLGAFFNDQRLKGVSTRVTSEQSRGKTLPAGHVNGEVWGTFADYGVFNFSDLFSQALKGKSYWELGEETNDFVKRYDFRFSDHMPIWTRLPLPEPPSSI
ncbi:MAG: endonuclease/exonuclease/phosphatase [bacterium]|nr:endonuclease/exonuclease/phosphatase [bacterium]